MGWNSWTGQCNARLSQYDSWYWLFENNCRRMGFVLRVSRRKLVLSKKEHGSIQMWGFLSDGYSLAQTGSYNRSMIPHMPTNLKQKHRIKAFQWHRHNPDLKLIDTTQWDLKSVLHKQVPSSFSDLKQRCKEDWTRTPAQKCERLINSYRKQLVQVTAAKGDSTSYWIMRRT